VTMSEIYASGSLDQPLSLWFAAQLAESGLAATR